MASGCGEIPPRPKHWHGKARAIIVQGAIINSDDALLSTKQNKYFELKNSWGAGAPLNSNYLLLLLYCSHPYYMNP